MSFSNAIAEDQVYNPIEPSFIIDQIIKKENKISDELKFILSNFPEDSKFRLKKYIERGCWGSVISAIDKGDYNSKWALKFLDLNDTAKKQLRERNLTINEILEKEGLNGFNRSYTNLISNRIESIKININGKTKDVKVIVQEYIDRFLSDYLTFNKPKLDEIIKISQGIVGGLSNLHKDIGRAHGDLKPDNIGYATDKVVKVADFVSSTLSSYLSDNKRDNIGFVNTRAPENFQEDSHPNFRSDVYSFGSILYNLFVGKYVFEDEFRNSKDPKEFVNNLDKDIANKIIKKKIKKNKNKIPKSFRKLLYKCLDFNNYNRYSDAGVLKENLNLAIENLDTFKKVKNTMKKFAIPLGILLSSALLFYAGIKHEPTELTIPNAKSLPNTVYTNEALAEEPIVFEEREIDLEPIYDTNNIGLSRNVINSATNNRVVAYLLKTYFQAFRNFGALGCDLNTESQLQIYQTYSAVSGSASFNTFPNVEIQYVTKSIEYTLRKVKNKNDKIDIEDLCVATRVGVDTLYETQKIANSFDYKNYIESKDKEGNLVIPKKERKFIETWMRYIN